MSRLVCPPPSSLLFSVLSPYETGCVRPVPQKTKTPGANPARSACVEKHLPPLRCALTSLGYM